KQQGSTGKSQPWLTRNQQWLRVIFAIGVFANYGSSRPRLQRQGKILFIFNKYQVSSGSQLYAGNAGDCDTGVSVDTSLHKLGDLLKRALHGTFLYVWRRKRKRTEHLHAAARMQLWSAKFSGSRLSR